MISDWEDAKRIADAAAVRGEKNKHTIYTWLAERLAARYERKTKTKFPPILPHS